MEVYIEQTGELKELKFKGTAGELLETLDVNSEEVLVVSGEEIVALDEELNEKDKVKVLSVVSGG